MVKSFKLQSSHVHVRMTRRNIKLQTWYESSLPSVHNLNTWRGMAQTRIP